MSKTKKIIVSILFLVFAFLLGDDVYTDLKAGATIYHVYGEVIMLSIITLGFAFIWKDYFNLKTILNQTENELKRVKKESELESQKWMQKNQALIQGLGAAIDQQLQVWNLTDSEKEIALLLMKGLSMKEIAEIRKTAERTVRQQSLAIYSKSGLSGRAELSAFFLEDILGPNQK